MEWKNEGNENKHRFRKAVGSRPGWQGWEVVLAKGKILPNIELEVVLQKKNLSEHRLD
jgi:hypothetical protein